jgi:hypothetical protein
MRGKSIRWVILASACASALVLAPSQAAATPLAPAGVRGWLGDWSTNFGELWFYSLTYTDVTWDRTSGQEVSSCQAYRDCQYGWLLRGLWHWPGHDWVPLKAKFSAGGTPRDYQAIEPCWLGPYSLEVPGVSGNACYAMLLYRYGDEERGGFWKACFLQENCTDHHYLHGLKLAEHNGEGGLWKVGFRFSQRGIPDGHTTISTQTGGAGSVIFNRDPANGSAGEATDGSAVFHIDDLGAAPEPQFTVGLEHGKYSVRGSSGETILTILGIVTRSTDGRCKPGSTARINLVHRHNPSHPDRIELNGSQTCPVEEAWTSTDKRRVSITIGSAAHIA